MDALDKVLHLPMRRALPDLSLGDGVVPDHRDEGRWIWLTALAGRNKPYDDDRVRALQMNLAVRGLTLEAYLAEQERRLRAIYPAVMPVRLYLRAPGKTVGSNVRAVVGLPRAGMNHPARFDYAQALMGRIMARPAMHGCEGRITMTKRPDGHRVAIRARDPVTQRFLPSRISAPPDAMCTDAQIA